jgi:glucose-1-phosphate thymidylyltransferase
MIYLFRYGYSRVINGSYRVCKGCRKRTVLKITCIEEVAYRIGFIDKEQFKSHADNLGKSSYANYLRKIIK